MFGLTHVAFALSTALSLTPPAAPAPDPSSSPGPCPRTCMRAARCCELGCPPADCINCSATMSQPIGQCTHQGGVYDLVTLYCNCSEGPSSQTTCGDV